ncbi:aldo/keto reductase [hydrocarbon metagenome]|uniref:Aldo/keto reductase n=1 Tax=hydrocarbon metagenome TaxID=938273 RepID=A0A0W8F1S0_9ZZZZ
MLLIMAAHSRLRALLGSPYRVGLGGEGVLRTMGREEEADRMLTAAYEAGIRYYDAAPAYAGSERYQGRFWGKHPERKDETFQASKSAQRDGAGAAADLARTLSLLQRDHLGLWQVHDLRDRGDIRELEGRDGALRTFYEAREAGTVRGIGVTGHHDPAILLHAVTSWDVDAVLLPVNPVERAIGGFLDQVIPAARERGIGVIAMKVLGAGNYLYPDSGLTADVLIRYALSQDVDLVIVGCSTPDEARLLARLGTERTPMDDDEQGQLVETVRPYAERLAYYRGVI